MENVVSEVRRRGLATSCMIMDMSKIFLGSADLQCQNLDLLSDWKVIAETYYGAWSKVFHKDIKFRSYITCW